MFYRDALKTAVEKLKEVENEYNKLLKQVEHEAIELYEERKLASAAIMRVEEYINSLKNTPVIYKKDIKEAVLEIQEFAGAIELESQIADTEIKVAGAMAGQIAIGGGVALLGPSAAMAVATTFGTASTGTAISMLSGAAANSAALAWLGGGSLAAGGGGMAAGNAFLALAGPVGWGIAGAAIVGGGALLSYKNKAASEEAAKIAIELEERSGKLKKRIADVVSLKKLTEKLRKTLNVTPFLAFGNDCMQMSQEQLEKIGVLSNNAKSLGKLISRHVRLDDKDAN